MHIAEGLLPLSHAAGWSVAALPPVVLGLRGLEVRERVRLGMVTALVFAVTLFPVPVPVVGVTSHMCATPVLGILLGPRRVVVPTAVVLLVQALFFAHGGLTTLGANLITLGVVGPWVGFWIARGLFALRVPTLVAVGLACGLADAVVYVVDAGILGAALAGAEPAAIWWRRLLVGLAPAQAPLAILEGLLSAWLLRAVARSGRWTMPAWLGTRFAAGAALMLVLAAVAGGGCSGDFGGLDEKVFEGAGAKAGRASRPLLDVGSSEIGRALFGGAMLVAGFVLGRGWSVVRATVGAAKVGPTERAREGEGAAQPKEEQRGG
jgi:cobalt/nickel transport system permease protein